MKTSNKILIAATVVVIAWLTIYDSALKAEYVKGDFRQVHYHMQQLKFTNFNTIEHNAGNIVGIHLQKGPYGIWVNDELKDRVTITQHGQTLQIDYIDKKDDRGSYWGITISCPDVVAITTKPFLLDSANIKFGPHNYYPSRTVQISGFNQPAMNLQAGIFTDIELDADTIDELTANIGDRRGRSSLDINTNNKIQAATFKLPGKSKLKLSDLFIDKVNYTLSDSSEVNLTGKASHLLEHQP